MTDDPTSEDARRAAKEADPDAALKNIKTKHAQLDLRLKRTVGWGGIALLVLQMAVADYLFWLYGHRRGWQHVPASAISAWLGACVVQVAVIVQAITKYLFSAESRPVTTD